MIPIADTHRRYLELVARHGTDSEKQLVADTLREVRRVVLELRDAGVEYTWEPMTEIIMPDVLVDRAIRVAHARIEQAKKYLEDKEGAVRNEDNEIRSVLGQYAACLIMGINFDDVPRTANAGRAHGNIGSNLSAFIPNPGSYQLIVGVKEDPARRMILIHQLSTKVFACPGWFRAGDAQTRDFAKTNVRNGVESRFFIVPASLMRPLRELWE